MEMCHQRNALVAVLAVLGGGCSSATSESPSATGGSSYGSGGETAVGGTISSFSVSAMQEFEI